MIIKIIANDMHMGRKNQKKIILPVVPPKIRNKTKISIKIEKNKI